MLATLGSVIVNAALDTSQALCVFLATVALAERISNVVLLPVTVPVVSMSLLNKNLSPADL